MPRAKANAAASTLAETERDRRHYLHRRPRRVHGVQACPAFLPRRAADVFPRTRRVHDGAAGLVLIADVTVAIVA